MGALKEKVESAEIVQDKRPKTIMEVIKENWSSIEAVMPKHVSSERLFQTAISTINRDPKLAQCDMATLLSCLMRCSALGLEPSSVDGLGRAYILPFRNHGKMEATFILGYKGMIDLARRSGEIMDISARAVFEGDEFSYEFGLDERLRHIPGDGERTADTLTHVYCVCHFKDGGHYIDVMTKGEVDAIRARSNAKDSGPWVSDYIAMAIKSVVRRSFRFLPVSVEAQMAAVNDETSGGYTAEVSAVVPELPEPTVEASEREEAPTEDESRSAVCHKCGNVISGVTADADLADLNATGCCEAPDYGWVE